MADWIIYVILAFVIVNLFWFVVLPILRTGGSALPIEQLPAQARLDITEQIGLGNTRQAIALLRQTHPMSERRAAHTVATWSKTGAAPAAGRAAPATPAAPPSTTAIPVVRTAPRALSPEAAAEIDRLVAAEQKIQAIKVYREHTGVGLKEAKDAVEAWQPGSGASAPQTAASAPAAAPGASMRESLPAPVASEIDRLVAAGQKIAAIKALRDSTGLGLAESKRAIDHWG